MSTVTEFIDGANFEEAMKSVRDDSTEDRYLVVSHVDNDPNRVSVSKVGQNLEEIAAEMDDTQVMYALARYESTFDMSKTVKFVHFRWIGDQVPFVKKGRYGVVSSSIQQHFNPYHLFLEISSREDFNPEKILQQLEETSGKKSKVIENIKGRQERGFTASQLPKRGPASKAGFALATEGAKIEITEEVYDAIAAVRNNDDTTRWMLSSYFNCDPAGPIEFEKNGEADIEDMKICLRDDAVMYGLYRVEDFIDNITTVKFVYIVWVGNSVKPMTKAKVSTHKGTMEQLFGPAHVTIFATDQSDISEQIVMEKVTSASGTKSHVK